MVYDNISRLQEAKNWIKAERKFFIEHLTDELGSAKAARLAWRKLKAKYPNALELEAKMEELYEDATELR